MTRKNLFLTISLLVMVGALVAGIMLSNQSRSRPESMHASTESERPGEAPELVSDAQRADAEAAQPGAAAGGPAAIRGRLVREDGTPAAGVAVGYREFPTPDVAAEPVAEVRTDAAGRFSIEVEKLAGSISLARESKLMFEMTRSRRISLFGGARTSDLGDLVVFEACTIAGVAVDRTGRPLEGITVEVRSDGALMRASASVETGSDGRFEFAVEPGVHRLTTVSTEYVPAAREVEVARGEHVANVVLEMERGASITGLVVDDRGVPVQGARVAPLRKRRVDPNTQVDSFDAKEASVTDANGSFSLGGLGVHDGVHLRAWAAGHVTNVVAASGGPGGIRIELPRHGAIEGVLVDGEGRPVEGSAVRASAAARRDLVVIDRDAEVETDAEGRFRIEGVEPGKVELRASGARHRPITSPELLVRSGDTTDAGRLVVEVGAAVAVLVLDAQDRPVAGAEVVVEEVVQRRPERGARVVERHRAEGRGDAGPRAFRFDSARPDELGRGETDEEGRVTIAGLPAGTVVLRTRHEEHASGRPVQLALPRAGTVEAQVTMRPGGFARVTTSEQDGSPRGGAEVVLRGPHVAGESPETIEQRSGDDGRVLVGPLAPGAYEAVLISAPGAMRFVGEDTLVRLGDEDRELEESRVKFEVLAGQTTEISLVFPVLTMLTGRVTDASGVVDGAVVELRARDEPMFGLNAPHSSKTGADGVYSIDGLAAGTWIVSWARPSAVIKHETELEIPAGQDRLVHDLVLGGGELRLVVHTAEGGVPLRGATVSIERASAGSGPQRRAIMVMSVDVDAGSGPQMMSMKTGGPGSVETDAAGLATLQDVPPGTYKVVVRHPKHASVTIDEVIVQDGQTTEPPGVVMQPGGHLRGTVTGFAEDTRLKFASVEFANDGAAEPRTEIAMNGVLEVDGLAPGSYSARAREARPGAADWGPPVTFEIVAGEHTRVEIPLR